MIRFLRFRFLPTIAVALAVLAARTVSAQLDDPEPSAEQREQQFEELAAEAEYLQRQANILRKVVQLAKPAVVHIDSEHNDGGRYARHQIEEAGSGTLIKHKDRFYVLTNRHVVKGATPQNITIKLADGRVTHPTRIWADPPTDIAVMAIDVPRLVPARIGDSNELEIGDFVLAVGSPFNLSHSVTFGIVSAKGRRDLQLGETVQFQDFIQTDAAINPGNSGGPLLNLKGEVVGMNTAIASSSGGNEGIGFTIPINMVMIVARQLIDRDGSVSRAYLGVNLDGKFTPVAASKLGLSRPRGARVSGLVPRSPAELAKLQAGDVILEFNGVPIESDSHLMNLVSLTDVGREVPLLVLREGRTLRVTVKVSERAAFEP